MQNMKLNLTSLIDMMFDYFSADQSKKNVYVMFLKEKDIDWLNQRVCYLIENWKPSYGEKIPSISEIVNGGTDELNAEIELAWQDYVKKRNNHLRFEVIPDLVFTVRQMLGGQLVSEDATDDGLMWQKKDFYRIYASIKKGNIPLMEDPMKNKYMKIVNTTLLIPDGVNQAMLYPDVRNELLRLKASEEQVLFAELNYE